MTAQYLRKMSLIVANAAGNGLDLANLHCQFEVNHWVIETPNTLVLRVHNLSDQTQHLIQKEFTQVVIKAGYEGNYGTIFTGNIKQLRRGRENATDTYLDIFAADADIAYNWAVVNQTLAAGYTQADLLGACARTFNSVGAVELPATPEGLGQFKSPRGRALFGMTRSTMRDLAASNKMTWGINDGKLNMLAESAYLPGEAVVMNATTGMIGLPEQTQDGIMVVCLLNPSVGPGTLLKINNADIVQYLNTNNPIGLNYTATDLPISLNADGYYKVLSVDHVGNTRGNAWETRMITVAVDSTVLPIGRSVLNTTVLP